MFGDIFESLTEGGIVKFKDKEFVVVKRSMTGIIGAELPGAYPAPLVLLPHAVTKPDTDCPGCDGVELVDYICPKCGKLFCEWEQPTTSEEANKSS